MKSLPDFVVRLLSVLSLLLFVFIIILISLWKSSLPCPDTKLKLTRLMIRNNELNGKNISICGDYFGDPLSVGMKDNDTYKRIYCAGHTYTKFMGMYDSQYYNIAVYYNSEGIITDAEICLQKGG
ncbi:MAG: hypothetical protein Q4F95_08235 [Oscillospiraceae bacterium]|nr:hypothetical protein [Oscillospiraceae bacterium]